MDASATAAPVEVEAAVARGPDRARAGAGPRPPGAAGGRRVVVGRRAGRMKAHARDQAEPYGEEPSSHGGLLRTGETRQLTKGHEILPVIKQIGETARAHVTLAVSGEGWRRCSHGARARSHGARRGHGARG